MKFLELTTRTYIGRDFKNYIKSAEAEEGQEDLEQWQIDLKAQEEREIHMPKPYIARIYIKPDKIESYIETFSLEEIHENPDNPAFDCVDINLEGGEQLTVLCTLKEFQKKLRDFYNEKD